MATIAYPFTPKTNARLEPGQFWSIPLSDGRFACGRVLGVDRDLASGRSTRFIAGLHDWVGSELPTSESIAGAPLLEVGHAHIRAIVEAGGAVLGQRPLEWDSLFPPRRIRAHWSSSYPMLRAERRFIASDPPPRWERRTVSSPLTDEMLRPSLSGRGVVQFSRPLTDLDFRQLAEWLDEYPRMALRVYGSSEIRDLAFLRFFPRLTRFAADALHELESLDGMLYLSEDLAELGLGATRRKLDLTVLGRFPSLKTLNLEGQTKNIEIVSSLTALEALTLRSITLPDLTLLLPLKHLLSLSVKLGGTKDLTPLPRVGELRYLELWLVKGLADVSTIGRLPHLRYLFLQALKQVQSLPDLSDACELRRIHLETMKSIRDLQPLATAPALEEVLLIDMRQLEPDDLQPLVGLPSLAAVTAGLGSIRKNTAARTLLGLPEVNAPFDWGEGDLPST